MVSKQLSPSNSGANRDCSRCFWACFLSSSPLLSAFLWLLLSSHIFSFFSIEAVVQLPKMSTGVELRTDIAKSLSILLSPNVFFFGARNWNWSQLLAGELKERLGDAIYIEEANSLSGVLRQKSFVEVSYESKCRERADIFPGFMHVNCEMCEAFWTLLCKWSEINLYWNLKHQKTIRPVCTRIQKSPLLTFFRCLFTIFQSVAGTTL